ncbi:MAG: hypothetical protein WDA27_13130 [Actinomycetota bacterium]
MAFTVKQLGHVPTPESAFVTVIVRAVVAASDATVITAVIWDAESLTAEATLIPDPEKTTEGLVAKFEPAITML